MMERPNKNSQHKKYKSYVEKEAEDRVPLTPTLLLLEGIQNVYYILASFIFGLQFAKTNNILYLFLLFIPIIIKLRYDKQKQRVVVRIFR